MTDTVRRAVCPGSYDPVTHGHLDVIARAAAIHDEVVVAVLHNPAKAGTFSVHERIAFIERGVAERLGPGAGAGAADNGTGAAGTVRVEAFAGTLLVDVCRDLDASVIVKGLRGSTDFEYELPMALMNRHLTGIETVFIPGDPALAHVSSSLVKEVVRFGGDVTGLVPDEVRDALVDRLRADG
ncbi:MAG TPA: pantetheine-phosphate adenylyltransferase [Ornithinibacter sp.]|uniref:pantetheine-phosphate adenylyltransferase n=1 Tax=Ornithinibacter sp. TaxID=2862748 RepID=UPI001B7054BD|nr:pantetheine-phosphate adenylyltransferase [Ornithinibacter sp.]MBP6524690.1 pantetheine-phosphate adenylyltransferase [Dermatophilaceae bacterium]HQV82429.1 pantetheine-phosphate adenylyltransferase [Ornithinibacter sp.]HQW72590.1 pantetheine-phosphate adenylyltransferase [Ornithinibacter sp.]HQZ09477.1 pantetheine-phosphate adenylyltransferase [Ornithinibacter sp.]HRA25422.1 pantetheine-phosphate adenylyltransferase [Ornithinibacter sp.]